MIKQPHRVWGNLETEVTGVTYDSRQVRPGNLFVAMTGEVTDGNKFVPQAIDKGAAAIVSERDRSLDATWIKVNDARKSLSSLSAAFYNHPSRRITLIGITGTNGKTTTSYLLESILRAAGERVCLTGTINSRINGEQTHLTDRTTPESSDLMRFLDDAIKQRCRFGVMEVSSHALDRMRVYGCKFRAAVFTNLTREHLDYHRTFRSYFRSKRALFINAERNYPDFSIINVDDPWGRKLAREIRKSHLITYGFSKQADVCVERCRYDFDGMRLEARVFEKRVRLQSPLPGKANVYNVLASVATADALSIPHTAIRNGVSGLRTVPGRFERIDCGQPFTLLVDYAHTDDALKNLLELVTELAQGRTITVFGCGGDRDRTKRPLMGEVAGLYSDLVVATSDNPRSEDPEAILKEIETGLKKTDTPYVLLPDRRKAIEYAIGNAQPNDVVVLAGKGHETTQVLTDRIIPFDDREVARELLNCKGQRSGVEGSRPS